MKIKSGLFEKPTCFSCLPFQGKSIASPDPDIERFFLKIKSPERKTRGSLWTVEFAVKFKSDAENELKEPCAENELMVVFSISPPSKRFASSENTSCKHEQKIAKTYNFFIFLPRQVDGGDPGDLEKNEIILNSDIFDLSKDKMELCLIKGKRSKGSYTMDIDPVGIVKMSAK